MKKIHGLVVGATTEARYALELAQKMNIETYAIDGNPSALGLQYAMHSEVVDIRDELLVSEYMKANNIDFIIPTPIGRYLSTVGAVNELLDLKGLKRQGAINCTDKWVFHQNLNSHGLRNGQAYLINPETIQNDYEITYPAIIKPRFGSGSRGVVQVENKQELQVQLDQLKTVNEDYILEQAALGVEFGVDGAVIDGEFKLVLLREKILTPLPYRQAIGYYSSFDEDKYDCLRNKVDEYLKQVVKVLDIDNCLLHADLMVGDDLFLIEISGRPSGHNLHNFFTIKATGKDMLLEYFNYQCNQPFDFSVNNLKNIVIHYFNLKPGQVKYVPNKEELLDLGLLDYQCNIKVDDQIELVKEGSTIMSRGYFIIEGLNRNDIDMKINQVLNKFIIE